ncbi:MAG: copper amine oxidase N-terminal domain-containing protein, partial [Firmicutes bacterium]|nr:copper amine oxidase N-terminal domain-containing protein [Bacillota bacterium]
AMGRIDILLPLDASVNQTVDILIKPGAGITNPDSAGRYAVGLMTSRSSSISQYIYDVTANSISSAGVAVSPATAGANARYSLSFFTDPQGGLAGGQDTITVKFPAGTYIPDVINASSITVNGYTAQNDSVAKSGQSITFGVPVQVIVAGRNRVDINISKSAGIVNGQAGTYTLSVSTSREPVAIQSEPYNISGGSVSTPRVTVTPPATGVAAEYTISFNVSATGNLVGGIDTISISFPQEINLPLTISRSAVTVNGRSLDSGTVTLSGQKLTFTIPFYSPVEAEGSVTVKIKPEANIINPGRPGNNYRLSVSTSKDGVAAYSESYSISDSSVKSFYVNVTTPAVSSAAGYDLSFKNGPYGLLEGIRDSITITFPVETSLPSYISRNNIKVEGEALDAGSVVIDNHSISFLLPSGVNIGPGETVNIKISSDANIINPPEPGAYYLKVSTSKNPAPVKSNGYSISGNKLIILVISSKTAFVDGRPVSLDVPAMILDGRTLAPVRFAAESLGFRVDWDEETREVTISLNGKTIKLTIDSEIALVNGRQQILDTKAIIIDGRTLVPIRFLAENFGSEVNWDSGTRTVTIKK